MNIFDVCFVLSIECNEVTKQSKQLKQTLWSEGWKEKIEQENTFKILLRSLVLEASEDGAH